MPWERRWPPGRRPRSTVCGAGSPTPGPGPCLRSARCGSVSRARCTSRRAERSRRSPAELTHLVEPPWADPFTRLDAGDIDVAVVLAPSTEDGFRRAWSSSRVSRSVSRSPALTRSPARPLAAKERVTSADLAGVGMVAPTPRAPAYWREANAPHHTEDGYELHYSATATTLQEALPLVASNWHGVLLCRAAAACFSRPGVRFVHVPSLPDASMVALTRHDTKHPLIARFSEELALRTRAARQRGPGNEIPTTRSRRRGPGGDALTGEGASRSRRRARTRR
ncbi:LysR substrate-binding domain-containing protein [Streptomyces sp. PTD5-9]|uniref:LysR substrate-binding domain-containing protein n=1 Tax=Streptomyces sp. PTD5-9 TaxID=3120150 RepID=UPI00300AFEDB